MQMDRRVEMAREIETPARAAQDEVEIRAPAAWNDAGEALERVDGGRETGLCGVQSLHRVECEPAVERGVDGVDGVVAGPAIDQSALASPDVEGVVRAEPVQGIGPPAGT